MALTSYGHAVETRCPPGTGELRQERSSTISWPGAPQCRLGATAAETLTQRREGVPPNAGSDRQASEGERKSNQSVRTERGAVRTERETVRTDVGGHRPEVRSDP
jgi:hypothetical protein